MNHWKQMIREKLFKNKKIWAVAVLELIIGGALIALVAKCILDSDLKANAMTYSEKWFPTDSKAIRVWL